MDEEDMLTYSVRERREGGEGGGEGRGGEGRGGEGRGGEGRGGEGREGVTDYSSHWQDLLGEEDDEDEHSSDSCTPQNLGLLLTYHLQVSAVHT